MKSTTLLLTICIAFSLNSCSQDFKKLNKTDTDPKKIELAQSFANDYFSKLKNGSYYQFQNEAIEAVKNQLTEQNQKLGYNQLKDQFGDFQSLDYEESWIQTKNSTLTIIRFKGDFDKSHKKLEIRVILDELDKINGFWIKPWSDIL